jgi:hypothetical protein
MKNRRGLKTKENLVTEIILLKKGNNRYTASGIRDELLRLHPGSKSIPKERAIYKILERNKDKTIPSDLDSPWSLGSCLKYGISPEVVIFIQQQLLRYPGRFLTIRRARWYSKLHPLLFPLLEKAYPEQASQNQIRLFQIASFNTRMEQISEINGEDYPDTRALDNTFIFTQDFSHETIKRIWNELYRNIKRTPSKVMREKTSELKIEQVIGGELTKDEAKLFDKYLELDADESNPEKAINFVKDHPEIQPFVEKWMAFSLRRDIRISSQKEGEK